MDMKGTGANATGTNSSMPEIRFCLAYFQLLQHFSVSIQK